MIGCSTDALGQHFGGASGAVLEFQAAFHFVADGLFFALFQIGEVAFAVGFAPGVELRLKFTNRARLLEEGREEVLA